MTGRHLSQGQLPQINAGLFDQFGYCTKHEAISLDYHQNNGHELTIMIKGEAVWMIEDGPALTLQGGMMGVTQPHITHQGRHGVIAPCHLFWVVLNFDAEEPTRGTVFNNAELQNMKESLSRAGNTVIPVSRRLIQSAAQFTRITDTTPNARFWVLSLLQQIAMQACDEIKSTIRDQTQTVWVDETRAWLDAHLDDLSVNVPELASHLKMSERTLYRQFLEHTGMTPVDFITRHRLSVAQRYLLEGSKSITDIAMDCGFSSSQYFAKCFKKCVGMPPSAYRSRYMPDLPGRA